MLIAVESPAELQCGDLPQATPVEQGILPDVERREMKSEGVGQIDPWLQILFDDTPPTVFQHALIEKFQVAAEFAKGAIGAVPIFSRICFRQRLLQPIHLHPDEAAIRLRFGNGRESRCKLRPLSGGVSGALAESLLGRNLLVGHHQLVVHPTALSQMSLQGGPAQTGERLPRDVRCDKRVTVAIAADPRAEREESWHIEVRLRVGVS